MNERVMDAMQAGRARIADERVAGVHVVAVAGELDAAGAPRLRDHLTELIDHGADRVVLDLSGLDFLDSVATAAIVGAHRRLEGRLAVVAQHRYVLLIFEAGGLDGLIAVFRTRRAALASLAG
jgi:anti-sigma B factor antagonist